MNEEQEIRLEALKLVIDWKSKLYAAAITSGRAAEGLNPYDTDIDDMITYIKTGIKPKIKKQ